MAFFDKHREAERAEEYAWWQAHTEIPRLRIALSTEPISKSRFGGPSLGEPPMDGAGRPMRMLCALFCEEFGGFLDFPTRGVLRFYISEEVPYGIDYQNPTEQKNFRVLYNESPESLQWQKETPSNDEFPVKGCYYCTFRREEKAMPLMDYRFRAFFARCGDDELTAEEEMTLNERFSVRGHAVGGYADFTQDDPRAARESLRKYDTTLLKIDSVYRGDTRIEFGDAGICNFLIPHEKLKACDFSDVLYWWDCY